MILLIPILVFLAFLIICALMTVGEPLNPTRPLMSYDQAREYAHGVQKMISCKTVSRKDGFDEEPFAQLRQVMEENFPLVHQRCRKLTFGDDCWVYLLPGEDTTRNIMLMSHHDVVDAQGNWQHPPFAADIADGKLWGRGTVDTKTPLYAMFAALEELLAEGYCPQCNLWLASSHNEEQAGDGIPLAAAYFKENGIRFDFVLDEGGAVIDPPMAGITCAKCAMVAIHEKGRHKLTLTAEAGSGHAGLTAGARSTPTERMADFISEFRKEDIFIRRMTPELEGMFKAMTPYMTFPMKVVFANLWLFKPLLVKFLPKLSPQAGGLLGTTCAFNDLTTEDGGKRCVARIMLRCIDGEDLQQDIIQLRQLAAKYDIAVEDGESEYHAPADPTLPPYQIISKCIRSVFPDVPVIPFILPAGTDARTLTELCPCVLRFAPLRLTAQQLASVHGENENIDISAIGAAVVFYRRVLEGYAYGIRPEDPEEDDFDEEYEDLPDSPEEPPVEMPVPVEPESYLAVEAEADFSDFLMDFPEETISEEPETWIEYPAEEVSDVFLEEYIDMHQEELSADDLEALLNWEEII